MQQTSALRALELTLWILVLALAVHAAFALTAALLALAAAVLSLFVGHYASFPIT